MLIARKSYSGKTKHPHFKTYNCVPENQEAFRADLLPYQRKKGVSGWLGSKIAKRPFKGKA